MEKELLCEQMQIERKLFSFSLRENPKGRFLKVTEDVGGRRNTVIIPSTGMKQIVDFLNQVVRLEENAAGK